MSEEVILNRKLVAANTTAVQLLIVYTHILTTRTHSVTDRRTDGRTDRRMTSVWSA